MTVERMMTLLIGILLCLVQLLLLLLLMKYFLTMVRSLVSLLALERLCKSTVERRPLPNLRRCPHAFFHRQSELEGGWRICGFT